MARTFSLSAKTVLVGAAVLVVAVGLFGFATPTSVSTGPDAVALHYTGGAFTSTRFADCVGSSTRVWDGPGDAHFSYPASQSNFVFGQGGDGEAITFVTKDGIEMTVTGVANFLLNTDCSTMRKFHDLIGNRYDAYMEDGKRSAGWTMRMLPIYIGRPLDTAIDRAGQAYNYAELYTDPAKKAQWEQDVLEALPSLVNRQTDGDAEFFRNFAITLQKPEPPKTIKEALVKQQADVAAANARKAEAEAQVAAARAQVAVQEQEAQKIAKIVAVLGRDGYLRQYAIDHGQNPFQPTTSGLITGRE